MAATGGAHPTRTSRRVAHLLVAVSSVACLSGCQKGTAPDAPVTIARLLTIGALQTPPGGVLLAKVINQGGGFGFGESVASVEIIYAVSDSVTATGNYYQERFRADPINVDDYLNGCNLPTCEQLSGYRPAPTPATIDSYQITISAGAPNFTEVGPFAATLAPTPPGDTTYIVIEASGGTAG